MKLSVIIPCFNVEATLAGVVEKVLRASLPSTWEREIILVDDGSTDATVDILAGLSKMRGIRAFSLEENSGKGAAVKRGLREASGDFVVIQDADDEYDPNDYARLIAATDRADSVFGSRNLGTNNVPYSSTFFYGGLLVSKFFNLFFSTQLSDIATCYKLFPRRFIPELLTIDHDDFVFDAVGLTSVLARGGTIAEVPISYRARNKRQGKKLNLEGGLSIALALILARLGLHGARFTRLAMQFLRFFLTGSSAAVIHIVLLYAFTEYVGIWYLYSSIIAFSIAFTFNFTFQKYWVFLSSDHTRISTQLPLHLGISLINLVLNTSLLYLLVEYVHIWYVLAQVMTTALIALESFLVYRWIFR